MRYFTRDWYNRIQEHYFDDAPLTEEESDAPSIAYRAHLAEIGRQLPADLLQLATHLSLHDGLFKAVTHHQVRRQLDLRLRCGDHPSGYFDLTLAYRGATVLTEPEIGLHGLVNNTKYEVLYDEVDELDLDSDERYEHRLLLWPEGEVALRFSGFAYERVPVGDRYAP